jgi:uncharacterized protein (DUF169 family)
MNQLQELDITIRDYIKPHTLPIAVKLLTKGEPVPPKFKRPIEFQGYALGLCQGIGLARKYGWPVAFQIDDMACGPSLSHFGFVAVPKFQADGELVFPCYAKTKEFGETIEKEVGYLPDVEVETILLAPLSRAVFSPDVIVIYGNPAQMARLIHGALYSQGGAIKSTFTGRAPCVAEIVTPILTGEYNLVIPDGGERIFAMTGDDEMALAFPAGKIPLLVEGILATHNSGISRYPFPSYGLRAQPKFPEIFDPLVSLAKNNKS